MLGAKKEFEEKMISSKQQKATARVKGERDAWLTDSNANPS